MVCADGSQSVNNGEKPDPLQVLPLNFVLNLGQPVLLFLTVNNIWTHTNLHSSSVSVCPLFCGWFSHNVALKSSLYAVGENSLKKFVTWLIFQLWKENFMTSSTTFPPLCLQKIMYLCEKKKVNNKARTYLMRHTPWVKIRRTLQAICSGWSFTHTSGSWTWELTCWQMAARAINGGEKPDLLKPLNLIQNLRQPTTLPDSW